MLQKKTVDNHVIELLSTVEHNNLFFFRGCDFISSVSVKDILQVKTKDPPPIFISLLMLPGSTPVFLPHH